MYVKNTAITYLSRIYVCAKIKHMLDKIHIIKAIVPMSLNKGSQRAQVPGDYRQPGQPHSLNAEGEYKHKWC